MVNEVLNVGMVLSFLVPIVTGLLGYRFGNGREVPRSYLTSLGVEALAMGLLILTNTPSNAPELVGPIMSGVSFFAGGNILGSLIRPRR
jgi:hypothetical protein